MTKGLGREVHGNVEEGVSEPLQASCLLSVVLDSCLEILDGVSVYLA
jgi:hypothetical protein